MSFRIGLFVGLIAFTLAAVLADNFAKADSLQEVFRVTGNTYEVSGSVSTETTSGGPALGNGTGGQFYRLVWLSGGTSGYVGFSGTPYSATAATNPIFINSSTDMIVDAISRSPIIHIESTSADFKIRVEEVDRVR